MFSVSGLFDRKYYKCDLVRVNLDRSMNDKHIERYIANAVCLENYTVLESLIVQRTANSKYCREIITGKFLPTYTYGDYQLHDELGGDIHKPICSDTFLLLKGKVGIDCTLKLDSSIANLNEVKNYIVNNKFESNNLAERIDNCFNDYTIDSQNSLSTKEDIKKMLKM